MDEFEELLRQGLRMDGHMTHNHIELVSMEKDHAVFQLTIHSDSKNPYGMVHGGAVYALADNAAGAAAVSDRRLYVTQEGTLHFLSNQSEGVLRAEAKVRHRGKSTCLVAVDITGEREKLIATGNFTFFVVSGNRIDAI